MEMPILKPIPIETKKRSFLMRILIWFSSVRKWEVVSDWKYVLKDKKEIVIPKGFIFDGASIPRPLWTVLSPVGLLFIPGLIHDFAYRYDCLLEMDEKGKSFPCWVGKGKAFWDKIFRETSQDVNGVEIVSVLAWFALVLGGGVAWKKLRNNTPESLPERN